MMIRKFQVEPRVSCRLVFILLIGLVLNIQLFACEPEAPIKIIARPTPYDECDALGTCNENSPIKAYELTIDRATQGIGLAGILPEEEIITKGRSVLLSPETKSQPKSFLDQISQKVQEALAPTQAYINLIDRYQQWFRKYRALRTKHSYLKDPVDLTKEQYTIVDEQIVEERCETDKLGTTDQKGETDDQVFKALKNLVIRLEANLAELEKRLGDVDPEDENLLMANVQDSVESPSQEQVERAMGRVKNGVVNKAKQLLFNEAKAAVRVATISAVSTYIMSHAHTSPDDALSYLAPLVTLLGYANTPVATLYLKNVEFRVGLAIIDQLNLFKGNSCKWNAKKN